MLELHWDTITLPASHDASVNQPSVDLTILEARETRPPADRSSPILWRLLTTVSIRTLGEAEKILTLYRRRWKIEEFHRVLKSGCKIETMAHRKRERLQRVLAINAIIAWRIAAMTELGRNHPELSPVTAFSDIELAMLADFAKVRKQPPPKTLGDAFNLVATMGGHLHRKNDQNPVDDVLWNGHSALAFSAWLCSLCHDLETDSLLKNIGEQEATGG